MPAFADAAAVVVGVLAANALRSRHGSAIGWGLLAAAIGVFVARAGGALAGGEPSGDVAVCAAAAGFSALGTFVDTVVRARYGRRAVRGRVILAVAGWTAAAALAAQIAGTPATVAVLTMAIIAAADWGRRRLALRGTVGLALPIREPLTVVEGGRGAAINRHWRSRHQRHAFDLVVDPGGRPPRRREPDLWAYPSMDAPVVAPIPGTVVAAMDDLPDEPIGAHSSGPGNHVVIAGEEGLHVLLAHLRRGTIEVSVGDLVEVGSPIGHCGNSGDSAEPHLHVQAMRDADWLSAATVPIRFIDAEIVRAGRHLLGDSTDPRRNDRLEIDPAAGR